MTAETFVGEYLQQVASMANNRGVFPTPVFVLQGPALTFIAVADSPEVMTAVVDKEMRDPKVEMVAFGFDRTTLPDQGTALGNVFTYAVAIRGDGVRYGVVEYDKGNVPPAREVDEDTFWGARMRFEVNEALPGLVEFAGV